jgi:hypothetical protein
MVWKRVWNSPREEAVLAFELDARVSVRLARCDNKQAAEIALPKKTALFELRTFLWSWKVSRCVGLKAAIIQTNVSCHFGGGRPLNKHASTHPTHPHVECRSAHSHKHLISGGVVAHN